MNWLSASNLVWFYALMIQLTLLPADLQAEDSDPIITMYTRDEGFDISRVVNIKKDDRGFIWVCTADNNISRFDGYKFTHYNIQEWWSGTYSFWGDIHCDPEGNFLLSSLNEVAKYDSRQNSFKNNLGDLVSNNQEITG